MKDPLGFLIYSSRDITVNVIGKCKSFRCFPRDRVCTHIQCHLYHSGFVGAGARGPGTENIKRAEDDGKGSPRPPPRCTRPSKASAEEREFVPNGTSVGCSGPPRITSISDVTAVEGQSAELKCVAAGVPTPTVVWKRNGVEYPGQKVSYCLRRGCFPLAHFRVVFCELAYAAS